MIEHGRQYRTSDNRATAILEVKNVSATLSGKQILEHISFHVNQGEIVTIIGPNGSGKTTLLKLILGILPLQQGNIIRPFGLRVGYMPQKMVVDTVLPLTVERFLLLHSEKTDHLIQLDPTVEKNTIKPKTSSFLQNISPKKYGWADNKRHQSLHRLAHEVGIDHIFKHQMHSISGGEMQRVLLAYALLSAPDLLVLDEPVQGMDLKGQAEFYNLLNKIRKERHCGILMVSHDLHMVMQATDQVICINHHICCEGTPEDVSKNPQYVALFGKEQKGSMGVYTHHHDHDHSIGGEVIENKEDT